MFLLKFTLFLFNYFNFFFPEPTTLKSSDVLFSQEIKFKSSSKEIDAVPKVLPLKDNLSSLKQIKEKNTQFVSIDPLDPKANESGIS